MRAFLQAIRKNESGVAFIEFAYSLPWFLGLGLTGVEITHYVTTKMRLSQVALHLADHAARAGSGSLLAAKTLTQTHINDVLTGAGLHAGSLNLYTNGRVILSSLEPEANPNTNNRYQIKRQWCRGTLARVPVYGKLNDTFTAPDGMGPTGRKVIAPEGGATMFVEVHYRYTPLIAPAFATNLSMNMTEIASMMVRDRRDLTQVPNPDGVTISACT